MGLQDDIRGISRTEKDFRKFGLLIGGLLLLDGTWSLFRGKPFAAPTICAALLLILLGAIYPRALRWLYVAWMTLGTVLGWFVSNIILTLVFVLIVTPLGVAARLFGKDFLARKTDPNAKTYWIPRNKNLKRDYERQF